jgi:hypothetical protein
MSYVLIIRAEDGRHVHVYKSAIRAQAALEGQLGRKFDPEDVVLNRAHYDDWGRRLVLEHRPDGWSKAKEERWAEAYDARECGIATKNQLNFLASIRF